MLHHRERSPLFASCLHRERFLSMPASLSFSFSALFKFLLVSWWLQSQFTSANASTAVNRTFDSSGGDFVTHIQPIYTGNWQNANCPSCLKNSTDQATKALNGGWHEAHENSTLMPSLSLLFNGTAFYVVCFVPNQNQGVNYNTIFDVILDNQNISRYSHISDGTTTMDQQVVYSNPSIPNMAHNMTLQLVSGVLLWDYTNYTYSGPPSDLPPSTSHSHSHTGAIVGGVVGGLVGLFALAVLVFILRRRRRQWVNQDSGIKTSRVEIGDSRQGSSYMIGGGVTPTPFTSSSLDTPNPYPYSHTSEVASNPPQSISKSARIRREDLARQVSERERQLAEMQQPHPGVDGPGSVGGSSGTSNEEMLRTLNEMRAEVERLRAQQREMMQDMQPPPVYS